MSEQRIISWFSCGAASAVATKIALAEKPETIVAYCEVKEEHPDNKRFLQDCEKWFGKKILILGNDKYERSIYKVFSDTGWLIGPSGARCTGELKKKARLDFQQEGDIQVFGYTVEEVGRSDGFKERNPEVNLWTILIDRGLTKDDCKAILQSNGIELPAMYHLGYKNNNCIGCVKGGAGYWNKIKKDFPEQFERMAKTEELLGVYINKKEDEGGNRQSIPLRELPSNMGHYPSEPEVQCGIFCDLANKEIDELIRGRAS